MRPGLKAWLLPIAVFLVAVAVFLPALQNGFAYDDVPIIPGDQRVTEFQLGKILTTPYWSTPGFALYRPLVTLSFAADWALADGAAWWFHAVNAGWHSLASVAVFSLLLAWFAPLAAAVGALFFAVHPLHVEAVANVVGRAELMAATFTLLACAVWAHQLPRSRQVRFMLVALLLALALVSKESAVVAPGFLVLIDAANERWRSLRELPPYLRRTWPELLGLAALLAASFLLRAQFAGGLTPTHFDPIIEVIRAADQRVLTALQVWPTIVQLFAFPATLLADYGPRVFMPAEGVTLRVLLGFIILAGSVVCGVTALNRGRGLLGLALLWVPIALLPVSNLLVPIGVLLAERVLYTPSVVIAITAAAAMTVALRAPERPQNLAFAAVLAVFAALSVRTVTRIPDWRSTDSILLAQLRDRPDSFRAHWHAARIARRKNDVANALRHYARAVELWPYRERLIVEAAGYAASQNQTSTSLLLSRHGAQRWPGNLQLQRLLASNALDLGDTAVARAALARGLKLAPADTLLNQMAATLRVRTP